jgi:hypothetical protein
MTFVEKHARQPAILLAANNNDPANTELARHVPTFLAAGSGSQAGMV